MPYVPRPATTAHCAHCNASFEKRHASRKYCSNSCNVQASYARNGRPGDGRATRADLEQMLAEMKLLLQGRSTPTPPTPAAKAAAKARFAKLAQKAHDEEKITKATAPAPTAKAAATKPKKKITKATTPAPTAEAVAAKAAKKLTPAQLAKKKAEMKIRLQEANAALGKAEQARKMDAEWKDEKRRRSAKLQSTTK
jgi:hypothetical protein